MEIKVHLNLPYDNLQTAYQHYEGEITIQGNHYSYVKRKIMQDTLFLLCLPNQQKDKLAFAKTDYGKTVTDFGGEKQKEGNAKKENSFAKYAYKNPDYSFTAPEKGVKTNTYSLSLFFPQSFITIHDIPPEWYS